jgi:hypothetical protein
MKKILSFLPLIILLSSCQIAESQSISEEQREEQAFKQLINKIEETKRETIISQEKATKQESKIVNGAVEKIVTLKEEVKNLKSELDEKSKTINGIISDTGSKFKLLPISNN